MTIEGLTLALDIAQVVILMLLGAAVGKLDWRTRWLMSNVQVTNERERRDAVDRD